MPTIPTGVGIYPSASVQELALHLGAPENGTSVFLVMGQTGDERHDAAAFLAGPGHDVTRRHWEPDNTQVDWNATPESEAARWFGLILGGLNPTVFRRIYKRAVGPNEYVGGDPTRFTWACAFEVGLCNILHDAGIPYAWGSLAVGNIDPIPFATTFAPINEIADAVCYHLYLKPGNTTLEGQDEPYWAWRPLTWFNECRTRGVRFPGLFGGESGTYLPWTGLSLSQDAYIALLGEIGGMLSAFRTLGMPVVGHCLFAYGAEGQMGTSWNIDSAGLDALRVFNANATDRRIDPPAPPTKPPAPVKPPTKPPGGPAMQDIYPGAVFDPSPNESIGRQGEPIRVIVCHIEGGSEVGTDAWFDNAASQVSAHFSISKAGAVKQHVKLSDESWSNGIVEPGNTMPAVLLGTNPNYRTVSTEHEGQPGDALTEPQYQATLALQRWIIAQTGIVPGPDAVIGHYRISPETRPSCPGPSFPFDRLLTDLGETTDMTDQQRADVLLHLGVIWGESKADTIKVNPAESERAIHERVVGIKQALGLN